MLKIYRLDNFTGGIAEGSKVGYEGSFADGLAMDFKSDPDKLTVMPKLKLDNSTTAAPKFIVEELTNIWAYCADGRLYRKATTWDFNIAVSNSHGNGLGYFNSNLWIAGDSTLNVMETPDVASPTITSNFFVTGAMTFVHKGDRDQFGGASGAGNTYAIPTSISETAVNKIEFVPNKVSFAGLSVVLGTKGTGTLVATIHDANNTAVSTITLANADLTGTAVMRLTPSPNTVKLIRGGFYHIHITSSAGGSTLQSVGTTNDLSTAWFMTFFRPLESDTNYHMMKTHLNKLCIGNRNFLCTIDDAEVLNSEALTFPPNENVRCLETIGDYLAISTWKGDALSSTGSSRIYFWDGLAPTYNAFVDIDGQVNAMITYNNQLYIIHGTQNTISVYTGAITLLRRLKFVDMLKTQYTAPGAITVWEGLLLWGNYDGSASMDRAVYSLGKKNKDYLAALNKEFKISTAAVDSTVKIHSMLGISATGFYVGWEDSATYGVDIIDPSNYETEAYVQTLRFDSKLPNFEKVARSVSIRTDPLIDLQSLEVWYKVNNQGDFVYLDEMNAEENRDLIYRSFALDVRFYEIEFKLVFKTTTTPITLISFEMLYDEKAEFQASHLSAD